ncbi:aminopeptidase [Massilia sp. Root418]|uniref:M1 family metallopeptidase n=1 Tax=Massilia sp. Root418 TaxID=1736532 RepID=UPI0006FF1DAA|nr:M1 family metallopeptidase [Massilia sp. Root418]KQX01950.1 aminopeptidase [Massilia sp. Root418]
MQRSLISAAILSLTALAAVPAAQATQAAQAAGKAKPAKAGKASQGATAAAGRLATTQLPRNVRPSHYSISLTPDAQASTFSARAVIAIDVLEPTATVTLHALDLVLAAASIAAGPGQPVQQASNIALNADKQTATLTFARPLPKGSYQLAIDYSGKIGNQAAGLFSLDYDTPAGKKRALYTQFEAADARRMVPSWDEPAFRATFALEATVPAGQMAVSNMPVASTSDVDGGRKLVRFATTPKMSTYLLFFGLGDFERATATEGGTELGVVTVKGRLPQAQFVLDSSKAVLREYNDYFAFPYPLPKLDNVAAPGRSQFFGAMENWGAIMSFEAAMLLDPAMSTQADKQSAYSIAAHETAHQWFGNLVTMRWWDDLWLNEGFATWMAGRTTALQHPEWQTALNRVAGRNGAIERDALATTHPVVQRVATVEEAHAAFDEITYAKGGAIINMLENYVGEAAWRDGVRSYVKAHAYGNAVSDQLWQHIERAAGKPVTAIAHDFTLQPGVPLIRVSDYSCRAGKTSVTLTQGEYSKDQPNKKPLSWRVPVLAKTVGAEQASRILVSGGKASVSLPGCGPVLVNAGQAGYYRTVYTPKAYAALAASFGKLDTVDQLGLMTESWALGMAGRQSPSDALSLARATPVDAAPQVWGRIARMFDEIRIYARDNEATRARLSSFAVARLAPVLARVGWDARSDETAPTAILREQLIYTLGTLGDDDVMVEARRRYDAALAGDKAALPPALRRVVLGVVARNADARVWEQLHAAAKAEQSAIVKSELYSLLGQTLDPALAQRALELAVSGEPDATIGAGIISSVAQEHAERAFDFALANLPKVNGLVESSSRAAYFPGLAGGSASAAMVDKLKAYADANLPASARSQTNTAVSRMQYRATVIRDRMPEIDAWLDRQAL